MADRSQTTHVRYVGTTPGADSNTYELFTTITNGWPSKFFAINGIRKVIIDIKHDNGFTLNWYKSNDRGTSWEQVGTQVVGAPASTVTTYWEAEVSPYQDFKVEAVNSGTAQDPWDVDIALIDERSAAS